MLYRPRACSSPQSPRGLTCETRARRLRSLGEDAPAGVLERFEGREPAAGEEPDGPPEASADPRAKRLPFAQQRRCARGLETEQRTQLVARTVELRIAEAPAVVGR